MRALIHAFGTLVLALGAMLLSSLDAIIGYLILNVNWSLIFVIVIAVLVIWSVLKACKSYGKSI